MIHLNQNIVEVHIYGYYIKVNVAYDWGLHTKNWGVSINANMDDVNHPCSVEHRDEHG